VELQRFCRGRLLACIIMDQITTSAKRGKSAQILDIYAYFYFILVVCVCVCVCVRERERESECVCVCYV